MRAIISGGAGFIGKQLGLKLASKDVNVISLDSYSEQIHDYEQFKIDKTEHPDISFIKTDVREAKTWSETLQDGDTIYCLASETGTGQSMYNSSNYIRTNLVSISAMLDVITTKKINIRKIILTSSRAVYGEGRYECRNCNTNFYGERPLKNLDRGLFEIYCNNCSLKCEPIGSNEQIQPMPCSIYGQTKLFQEQLLNLFCQNNNIPLDIFRLQNVYGPGQSLKNPYTGILSIFTSLAIGHHDIEIFEDGLESRDFVHINDVVNILENSINKNYIHKNLRIDVGTGKRLTVLDLAKIVIEYTHSKSSINISGRYRIGDIRHNFADISKLKEHMNYDLDIDIKYGIQSFVDWAKKQTKKNFKELYIKSLKEF